MKLRRTALLSLAVLGTALGPSLVAASHMGACTPTTTKAALVVGDFYMVGTAYSFWEESNGIAGLQQNKTSCAGHPTIPADQCVASTTQQVWRDLSCTYTFLDAHVL